MSSYITFLELLVKANDMEAAYKRMLKGKDLKKSGEQVKKYIKQYGRMHYNPIYENSRYYEKGGTKVQSVAYYIFPFVTQGPLRNIDNLISLYKFFFVPSKVVVTTEYSYESGK